MKGAEINILTENCILGYSQDMQAQHNYMTPWVSEVSYTGNGRQLTNPPVPLGKAVMAQ